MIEDAELLHRYAGEKSEAAFAELVQRHVNFVYACALRRVGGDAHLAEDVTQQVFTALARSAAALARRETLSGWLFTTARNASAQVVRGERRRRDREQEAHIMNELSSSSANDADWQRLRPVLDDAMDQLNDDDRQAVLLRFSEEKSFAEIGARLRLTENTARMRVDRALEKMHAMLSRRGVTSTTAALGMALANQVGVAAPAGLAASVTGTALAAGAAAGSFLTFMSTSKITLGVVGVFAALATGTAVYQSAELRRRDAALATANAGQESLRAKLRELEGRIAAETKHTQAAEEDSAKLLSAVEGVRASQAAQAAAPITHDTVDARYQHAQDLASNGNWEAALPELLWCYDEGMVRVESYVGVRNSFLLGELMKLALKYPPAMAAMKERRDRAEQRMLASTGDFQAAMDFASLNSTLGDNSRNLETFDKLPPGDRRRNGLLARMEDQLIAAQRYGDIAQSRPFAAMSSQFESLTEEPPDLSDSPDEGFRKVHHDYIVNSTAENIEVLAGAGDLEHARSLAAKLFAYDGSGETKLIVQQHLARAAHQELRTTPTK